MFDNMRKVLDFDDLLFKSRNREYGAYQLRKRYNSALSIGIIAAIVIVSSAIVFPFVFTRHSDHIFSGTGNYVQVRMENFDPPMEKIIVPPAAPPPEETKIEEIVKYVPPVVVDSILPFETQQVSTDQILSQTTSDKTEATGNGSGNDLLSGQDGTETDEPFFLVEIMPSFKGGDINKFREWVQRRTNYPQLAIDRKIQGKVFLTFIVEPDGTLSSITVVKGIDPLIDNEAVNAIESSPKWTPGYQRGQAVRVRYSMWLNFVI